MPWRVHLSVALTALMYGAACGRAERASEVAHAEPAPAAAPGAHDDGIPDAPAATLNGIPDDVPVPAGLRSVSVSSEKPGSIVALFTGDLEPEEVERRFAEGLRRAGWSIDESRTTGSDLGLFARKDQRLASVVATRLSGKLHVELGLWEPKAD